MIITQIKRAKNKHIYRRRSPIGLSLVGIIGSLWGEESNPKPKTINSWISYNLENQNQIEHVSHILKIPKGPIEQISKTLYKFELIKKVIGWSVVTILSRHDIIVDIIVSWGNNTQEF